jgi:GTP-binding protein LepA
VDTRRIRNFSIIAHIDHGKSTLADRFLEITNTVERRVLTDRHLDGMDLEKERGITIKAHPVTMRYKADDGEEYMLNLIDTPGHVDFSYEVQKSLQACEGVLLLVDASQGVQAQTVANAHLAEQHKLTILPVLNKVDLAYARPVEVAEEIESVLCIPAEDALNASGKTGNGCKELLEALIQRIPSPKGDQGGILQALIFDAVFNDYRGVIAYVRVMQGAMKKGDRIVMLGNLSTHEVLEVGRFAPAMKATDILAAGEVGYVVCNIKLLDDVVIGDTITAEKGERAAMLPGFRRPKPMVFCGLYPTNPGDYDNLRKALEKLRLNDSSFTFEPENSDAMGLGFRCGFLGLLHMEIIQQRLERHEDLDLVQTAPTVTYQIVTTDGVSHEIHSPSHLPDPSQIKDWLEPIVRCSIVIPTESIGTIMTLCTERRGKYIKTEYVGSKRVIKYFDMPLAEIIYDFYDKLKSSTRGFGTMDYELKGFEVEDLVLLRVLVAGKEVDSLSTIVHRSEAEKRGRKVINKLRKEIPRHLFEVALQAAVYGKIVARETIKAMGKNVTAKCYGGDITRKRKLWEKQKEGKKRMKQVGNVEIPQKAFLAVLAPDDEE